MKSTDISLDRQASSASVIRRLYIYIYTASEKPVNDQSYGVLNRYGLTRYYSSKKIINVYTGF